MATSEAIPVRKVELPFDESIPKLVFDRLRAPGWLDAPGPRDD